MAQFFYQERLEKGVDSLACVDVGSDQLHHTLKNDQRISLYENMDIRDFTSEKSFEVISCDVSFISVLQIIEDIDRLSGEQGTILILYKPQFEVGREVRRDSRGVVMDKDAIARKREHFETLAKELGWELKHQTPSQITGKEGNLEYIYHFVKMGK